MNNPDIQQHWITSISANHAFNGEVNGISKTFTDLAAPENTSTIDNNAVLGIKL